MTELESYISTYFGVSPEHLSRIGSFFFEERYSKGACIAEIGKSCDRLCFVRSGLFRVYMIKDGREITQWISGPSYFVTELAGLIFDQPSRFTIQALGDSEVYSIRKSDYRKLAELIPEWNMLEKHFIARCFITLENRVNTLLSMPAEERYHLFFEENKELFNQVPLQYIASMLGMTPETFSRIRKKSLK